MRLPVIKACKICGTEFEGYTNARYCSPACKREYESAYARKWREVNRTKVRTYQRDYWRLKHSKGVTL